MDENKLWHKVKMEGGNKEKAVDMGFSEDHAINALRISNGTIIGALSCTRPIWRCPKIVRTGTF